MRRKFILLVLITFIIKQGSFSQGCPANIDFELGTFANWDCSIGTTSVVGTQNVITLAPSPPTPGRHEIISASSPNQKDPYGGFPTLCPYGGKYSVKLGNDNTGAEAEGISYTFMVPNVQDTFSFTYFYAVVFEDPGHLPEEQPRFFVTAYDVLTGALINCASYNYISTSSLPGFQKSINSSDVLYKNWSPVSIQFAGLANRKVRLEFKTADCTKGAHFGYAYLDVGTGCSNILATAPYCKETNSVILNAPYGFQTYTWYTSKYETVVGSGQSLTLNPPPATNSIFHVDMIPYPGFGCRDTVDAIVTPLPVPDTPIAQQEYFYCQYDYATSLTATGDLGNELWWYTSATGGIGESNAPTPSTAAPGVFEYYVSQKVLFGCESLRRKIRVTVTPIPIAGFTIDKTTQCLNVNNFQFSNTSANLDSSTYAWDWGDGKLSTQKDDNHVYTNYGTFTVIMKVLNQPVCAAQIMKQVTVIPNPVASFSYPPVICENQTPIKLTDNSSVPANLSLITNWWWQINGQVSTSQSPPSFTANAGKILVKLVVNTTNGCTSDTSSVPISVRYSPKTAFSYNSNNFCDNEPIHFISQAAMPSAATGESVVKWNWLFDNTIIKTDANPSLNLSQGTKQAHLVAESNFGCASSADSTFTVYPKPHIRLDINDSCVFRNINYKATDLSGTVDKWFWDFGQGLHLDNSLISNSYTVEGYNPVTLIGQTIYGCKDTIIRPFTIYDNKAFAGHDTLAAFTQPVQLNAYGGPNVQYTWSPAAGLSNTSIENPIALLDYDQLYKLDAITDKGCDSHTQVLIKRWKGPALYIPTAFTPNADGLNEQLSVFPVGIKAFYFFAVYNRFGQQVFYTTDYSKKWDGTFSGVKCEAANYVAIAKALDYNNQVLLNKVNVLLIR